MDCCLTDLCKASFVQRGSGPDSGNRGDWGSDTVVRKFWPQWIPYVAGLADGGCDAPAAVPVAMAADAAVPCDRRAGHIAEYGVLKIFQRMATAPRAWSWKDISVVPDHPTMTADLSDWEYTYACSRRKLKDWLANDDWWVLGDSGSKPAGSCCRYITHRLRLGAETTPATRTLCRGCNE